MRIVSMMSHLNCVEHQLNLDETEHSCYLVDEYANDVAIAFSYDLLAKLIDEGKLSITEKELYDLLHDGTQVEQLK